MMALALDVWTGWVSPTLTWTLLTGSATTALVGIRSGILVFRRKTRQERRMVVLGLTGLGLGLGFHLCLTTFLIMSGQIHTVFDDQLTANGLLFRAVFLGLWLSHWVLWGGLLVESMPSSTVREDPA